MLPLITFLFLVTIFGCISLCFGETQNAEDHIKKRHQGIKRSKSECIALGEREGIYDDSFWDSKGDKRPTPLRSRADQDRPQIPQANMGQANMGQADMGLIPQADMGLIPQADMGLIPWQKNINTEDKMRVNSAHASSVNEGYRRSRDATTYGAQTNSSMTSHTQTNPRMISHPQTNSTMMINPYSEY